MKVYKSELRKFPFPRSIETIKALAKIRGSEIGAKAAEAFEVMKIIKKLISPWKNSIIQNLLPMILKPLKMQCLKLKKMAQEL